MRNLLKQQLASRFSAIIFIACFAFPLYAQKSPVSDPHPEGHFATVNGAKLWYEIEGKGEPLLLIAGGPGSSHRLFHPFFSALVDSNRVIYFDAFGRGKSDRTQLSNGYTFDRDVDDIEGIRKELKLEKINVFGHSYGGMVAQAYALKYPSSVKRLILANTLFSGEMWQAGNDNANYEIRNQYPELWEKIQGFRAQGLHCSAKEHWEASCQVPEGLSGFYDASKADQLKDEFNPNVYFSVAGDDADFLISGDLARLDFRTQLKNLKMPVLILAGRFDRLCFPRFSFQFKKYASQAEFVMFEKAGHNPFIECPDQMFDVLRKFLSK